MLVKEVIFGRFPENSFVERSNFSFLNFSFFYICLKYSRIKSFTSSSLNKVRLGTSPVSKFLETSFQFHEFQIISFLPRNNEKNQRVEGENAIKLDDSPSIHIQRRRRGEGRGEGIGVNEERGG